VDAIDMEDSWPHKNLSSWNSN